MKKLPKEYTAILYKSPRNNAFIANCYQHNISGFGKTEEDAINELKKGLNEILGGCDIIISLTSDIKLCNCQYG